MDIVQGIRQALQDIVAPDLKALGARVDGLTQVVQGLREDMNKRFQATDARFLEIREDMNKRFEAVHREILALARDSSYIRGQVDLLVARSDLAERLTRLEERVNLLERAQRPSS